MDIRTARVLVVKIPEYKQEGKWIPRIAPTEAERFGKVEVVLDSGVRSITDELPIIEAAFENFTKDDYLVLMGSPIQMGMATYFAMLKTGGRVKFLIWQNYIQDYKVQEVIINGD